MLKRIETTNIAIVFCLLLIAGSPFNLRAQQVPPPLIRSDTLPARNLKVFYEAWTKINEKYYEPNFNGANWLKLKDIYRPRAEKAASREELLVVLRRMLGELNTSHVAIWFSVGEKRLEKRVGANFDARRNWIRLDAGFDTKTIGGRQVVVRVKNGSAADREGVRMGWTLVAVEKGTVTERDWMQFVHLREGQKAVYEFLDEKNKQVDLDLTTDYSIEEYVREARLLESGTGYIKFDAFIPGTADWLRAELLKLKQAPAIILDLRGNGGGEVTEVRNALSSLFAADTEFGAFKGRTGKIKEPRIKGGKNVYEGKLTVLIDEDSGSGAEIFAQLIKENARGRLIGTRTRGRVLNSVQYSLSDDFELLVAIRDYHSPHGKRLEGVGVEPDETIEWTTEDIRSGRDPVLERPLKDL